MKRMLLLIGLSSVLGCNSAIQAKESYQPAKLLKKEDRQKLRQVIMQRKSLSGLRLSEGAFLKSSAITLDSPKVRSANGILTDTRTDTSTKITLLKKGRDCFLTFNQAEPILIQNIECE